MPSVGPINNWLIFNKMNSNLAYFDVSHNIEILHLNDSNEINKQLEKKIEPMEPTLKAINLGNDKNPCLIKIGSTLNEKGRAHVWDKGLKISKNILMKAHESKMRALL